MNVSNSSSVAEEERSVCFICAAEHPPLWAIYECSHRVCSLCCLRMRELYGNSRCAWCKMASPRVVIVRAVLQADGTDHTSSYGELSGRAAATDASRGLLFADTVVQRDAVACLQARCPRCSREGKGERGGGRGASATGPPTTFASKEELKRHMLQTHELMACDICLTHRKCFPHELRWYRAGELLRHQREGPPGGHPACNLCATLFYSEDELTEHCRERHENCFICQRRSAGRPAYFRDYDELEVHFRREHWLCPDPSCLELKFVVFENELEYKAHQAEMHLAHVRMQRSAQNQFRRLDAGFRVVSSNSPVSAHREGTRDRADRGGPRSRSGEADETGARGSTTVTRTEHPASSSSPTLAPSPLPFVLNKNVAKNLIFGDAIGELAGRLQSLSLYEQRNVELTQTLLRDHGLTEGQLGSLKGHCRLYQKDQLDAASLALKLEGLLGASGLETIYPILVDLELDSSKRVVLERAIRAHLCRLAEFPALPKTHGTGPFASGDMSMGRSTTMNFARRLGASPPVPSAGTSAAASRHVPVATIRIKPVPGRDSLATRGRPSSTTVDPSRNPLALLGAVKSTAALSAPSSGPTETTSRKKPPPSYLQAVSTSSSVGIAPPLREDGHDQRSRLDEASFPILGGSRKGAGHGDAMGVALSPSSFPAPPSRPSVFTSEGQSAEPESFVIGDRSGREAYEDRKDELLSGLHGETCEAGGSTVASAGRTKRKGGKGTVLLRYG